MCKILSGKCYKGKSPQKHKTDYLKNTKQNTSKTQNSGSEK